MLSAKNNYVRVNMLSAKHKDVRVNMLCSEKRCQSQMLSAKIKISELNVEC